MAEGRRIIKKKGGAHAHHGGAWKVAYADFVTAMMALFMVMWLLASTDQQSRQEISRYFRTGILPDGDLAMDRAAQTKPSVIEVSAVPTPKKGPSGGNDEAKELGKAIERMVKGDPALTKLAAQVSITVTEEGVLIEAVDRDGQGMLFESASSELKPALVAFLDRLAPLLAERGNKLRVMGHTDARPYISKNGKTNWDLSYERASNARRVLDSAGLAKGQVTAVQAHGPSQLRNPADPYGAENRRLSILVLHAPGSHDEETPAEAAEAAEQPAPATETAPASAPAPASEQATAPATVSAPAPDALAAQPPAHH